MKNKYSLTVRGKHHEWAFPVYATAKHAEEWRHDGLIVDKVLHEIPQWVMNIGLGGLWMRLNEEMKWGK